MFSGEKLYELRKAKHISQEELASSIDVSRQAISKWEQNKVVPDTSNLIKLSSFFSVPLEYLTDEDVNSSEITISENDRHRKSKLLLILGGLIILVSLIMTYPVKIIEFRINGECFDNALNYLLVFPINIIVVVGIALSLAGTYRFVQERRKK